MKYVVYVFVGGKWHRKVGFDTLAEARAEQAKCKRACIVAESGKVSRMVGNGV